MPKFNELAEDLVQTLRGVADGRTWFDLRDHYRNTTLHAISLVCLTLCSPRCIGRKVSINILYSLRLHMAVIILKIHLLALYWLQVVDC